MSNKCPVCGGKQSKELPGYKSYKLFRCNHCDLIYCDPFKNPGNEFYEEFYTDIDCHNPVRYGLNPSQELFLSRNRRGRLLDVGCGVGTLLYHAKQNKFIAFGFDFDQKALEIAKDFFGLKHVYNLGIDSKSIGKFGKFDYVTLIDVLEHVDNPNQMIKGCHSVLKKGGVLVISVPNNNRKPDFIFKAGDNPPHHLTKWTVKSLENLLMQSGFDILFLRPLPFTSHDLYMYIKVNTFDKLKKVVKKSKKSTKRKEKNETHVSYEPSVSHVFLYRIRDVIVKFIEIILAPITFIVVKLFHFESDHLYVEAQKK